MKNIHFGIVFKGGEIKSKQSQLKGLKIHNTFHKGSKIVLLRLPSITKGEIVGNLVFIDVNLDK